jgi:ribosome modulation factor
VRLIHLSGDDYARVAGARNEGRQAGQKARTLNPYRRDGAEWAAWLTGWLDARNEDQ